MSTSPGKHKKEAVPKILEDKIAGKTTTPRLPGKKNTFETATFFVEVDIYCPVLKLPFSTNLI